MIGIDTNVLVRLVTRDDQRQADLAADFVSAAVARGERLHINLVVTTELVWVLQRRYGAARAAIVRLLDDLLTNPAYDLGDRMVVEDVRHLYASSNVEFSDCVIVAKNNAAGCAHTATFDRPGAKLPGMKQI